jgi:hypothetical protein
MLKKISRLSYVIINFITKRDNVDDTFKMINGYNRRLIGKTILLCKIEFYGPHGIVAKSFYVIPTIK